MSSCMSARRLPCCKPHMNRADGCPDVAWHVQPQGAKTPARLPLAVERFLQERGLAYSEPQRGLLKIAV